MYPNGKLALVANHISIWSLPNVIPMLNGNGWGRGGRDVSSLYVIEDKTYLHQFP